MALTKRIHAIWNIITGRPVIANCTLPHLTLDGNKNRRGLIAHVTIENG